MSRAVPCSKRFPVLPGVFLFYLEECSPREPLALVEVEMPLPLIGGSSGPADTENMRAATFLPGINHGMERISARAKPGVPRMGFLPARRREIVLSGARIGGYGEGNDRTVAPPPGEFQCSTINRRSTNILWTISALARVGEGGNGARPGERERGHGAV